MKPAQKTWKVGELAQATGITVRTLHHYDEIGLLKPSQHTDSGHRLYTQGDIARLQHVMTLRQLGLALEDVQAALDQPDFSFLDSVVQLRAQLREKQIEMQDLDTRLAGVEKVIRNGEALSVEKMIQLVEVMTMFEKYLTKEQQEKVAEQGRKLGADRLKQAKEAEWPELIQAVQAEIAKGTDPADPKIQNLARRWMSLVSEFTAGDPKIAEGVRKMWESEPKMSTLAGYPGVDMPKLMAYISEALKTSKK